jgi:phage terminase small subunit
LTDDIIIRNRPDGLTEMQARLAEGIVLSGMNKTAAIKAAGYASVTSGFNALRVLHVRDYIWALINEHMQDSSIVAARTISDLMTNARSDYVKLEASKVILDRAGFKPVDRHAHYHAGEVTISIDLG